MKIFSTKEDYNKQVELYISSLDVNSAKQVRNIHNAMNIFIERQYGYLPSAGEIKWPVLKPNYNIIEAPLLPFHEAWSHGITDCVVHFYIDDRLFTRVFRNLEKYVPFICKCVGVIGTDVSQYADMPEEMRYRHAYCNASMSSILQNEGANLYPNVTWSKTDSFCYSFPDTLKNSVIAINSNGVHRTDLALCRWKAGYEKALELLTPIHIIRYGQSVEGEVKEISSYHINERLKYMRYGR